MSPMPKCATTGTGNPSPLSTRVRQQQILTHLEEYDRTHAPILWPAALNDDGTVNRDWSEEMLRIRRLFWEPLGATMVWHYADGRN